MAKIHNAESDYSNNDTYLHQNNQEQMRRLEDGCQTDGYACISHNCHTTVFSYWKINNKANKTTAIPSIWQKCAVVHLWNNAPCLQLH